jgi:hypothetical protein
VAVLEDPDQRAERGSERKHAERQGFQGDDAAVLVTRFTLTEYGVVIASRGRVVQLNVAGPFAYVLRGTLLLTRLLRLV